MTDGAKKRLLVVDDEKAIRHLLTRIAERAGFEVDSAADGVEALEMMERKSYDIAIVDLMMPRLSGYELVQKISALDPRPVVLVATAMANGDVASLDDSMVRRVIRKPFDVAAIASALVDTAKQIVEPKDPRTVEAAPPETAKVPVATEDAPSEGIAMAASAPAVEVPIEEPKQPSAAAEEPPPQK